MTNSNKNSIYYPGYEGCKLAVDVYKPDRPAGLLPLIISTGYGGRIDLFEKYKDFFNRLLEEGFAVALIDPRGVGASYGSNEGFFNRNDARDLSIIIDALGEEKWCNGNVGMFGGSNRGFVQVLVACEQPSHLKAIIPCDANTDMYYQNFVNGATTLPNLPGHHNSSDSVDIKADALIPREDEELLRTQRKNNLSFLSQYKLNMFRDTVNPRIGYAPNIEIPPWERLDELKYSSIKTFYNGGWYDPSVTGAVMVHKHCGDRLLIGPWRHMEIFTKTMEMPNSVYDWDDEYVRFFHANLVEGLAETGEPPIRYYTVNGDPGKEWKYSATWPVDNQVWVDLHLDAASVNCEHGFGWALVENQPDLAAAVEYTVDDSIQLLSNGRLDRKIGSDFQSQEEKCLCFTSEPVSAPSVFTGIPVVDIWISSAAEDGIFIAVLEEVTSDGVSHFITDGAIRASNRAIHPNPVWDGLGIPYHRGLEKDAEKLEPGKPVNLVFNLEAVSYRMRKGSRLKICIFCGAEGTYHQPPGCENGVSISLHTGCEMDSIVRMPLVVVEEDDVFRGELDSRFDDFDFSGPAEMYLFNKSVHFFCNDRWKSFTCLQSYHRDGKLIFETEQFTIEKSFDQKTALVKIDNEYINFASTAKISFSHEFSDLSPVLPRYSRPHKVLPFDEVKYPVKKNLHVATVPVAPGEQGIPNLQPFDLLPLYLDIVMPASYHIQGDAGVPCIIYIHGYGSSHHEFPDLTERYLEHGYAVASIEYRNYPPSIWPATGNDAKAAIRYLKANSAELGLDPNRFGVTGRSAGGHLAAMIAATNGDPATEGDIGGNRDFNSEVRAAAIYYPWTNTFSFGDQLAQLYPDKPERALWADGPNAPLGCIIGFSGEGKGAGELKKHLEDPDTEYRALIELAKDSSPVFHVSERSAPSVFVHGIYECNIQIPMMQSVEMFEALTRKDVKSLLLCNNKGLYGDDPEVRDAVFSFMINRV